MAQENGKGHCSAVFAVNRKGEVLIVRNPLSEEDKKAGKKAFWKIPAGVKEGNETPSQTAVREFIGESGGVKVEENDLEPVCVIDRGTHFWHLFSVRDIPFSKREKIGDEGEETRVVSVETLRNMPDFVYAHKRILTEHGLLL